MLERSERRGWLIGAAGMVLALLGVLAVFAQGPLRQVVGVPIVVDKTTGETTIQQRLSTETVPAQEALDKHNLAVFVRAREGYSWWWLQRDFDQVARMAVPTVFADYNRQFDGDGAVQKKLAATEEWRIHIVGVRLSPGGRRGNKGDATITYSNGTTATRGTESVNEGRWSVFGNLSYALPVGALTVEGGWMSGGSAIPEYPDAAKYDPGAGTVFGSCALRVAR